MVKWPWVSRRAYDAMERQVEYLKVRLGSYDSRVYLAEQRAERLMMQVIELRREGWQDRPAVPEVSVSIPEPLPPIVTKALDSLGLKGSTRHRMEGVARRRLASNETPDEVAEAILIGGDAE